MEQDIVLDVSSMEWTPLAAGLFTKRLRTDPVTEGRTALQRLVPAEGYKAPTVAHFHNVFEEIICVTGRMSFDSKVWLEPTGYVFHPPMTVHGFKSDVPDEAWFLSRVGGTFDVNQISRPLQQSPYAVGQSDPARPYVCLPAGSADYTGAVERGGARQAILSNHAESGEGSVLVRIPDGGAWSLRGESARRVEIFVLEGQVEMTSIGALGKHAYVSSDRLAAEGCTLRGKLGEALLYVTVTQVAEQQSAHGA